MPAPSGELRFQRLLDGELFRLLLDIDSRVSSVAFGWNASNFENKRLEIFRAGVLSGGGAGFAGDVFLHQRAAVVVGASVQAKLGQTAVQFYPRNLNIVDGTREHDARESVNFQMLGQSGAAACESLMEEQSVLMDEAERDELGEPASFTLNVAEKQ